MPATPLTVQELREQLDEFPDDASVFYAEPMGADTLLSPIKGLSLQTSHYKAELQMHAVAKRGVAVVVLE